MTTDIVWSMTLIYFRAGEGLFNIPLAYEEVLHIMESEAPVFLSVNQMCSNDCKSNLGR